MDIEAGLLSISSRRRADGETAFPDIATVLDEVRAAGRTRRAAEARERRMADEAAERRRFKEHPEDFIADDEIKSYAEKLAAKVGFEQPKEIVIPEPVLLSCPHCSAELPVTKNLRFWEPEELEAQASRIRELRRLADKNRMAQ